MADEAPVIESTDSVEADGVFDPEAQFMGELRDVLDGDSNESGVEDAESAGDSDDAPQTFTVKVDGEEVNVTLDELLNGYSRQADYTKKTQMLAQERERLGNLEQLAQALNSNPQAALQELAQAFGVDVSKTNVTEETKWSDLDDDDPLERELKELKQWREEVEADRQRQRQESEDAALQRELETIKRDNSDPELNESELLQFAIDNQIFNLKAAYDLFRLRRQKPDVDADKVDAKRNAPPIEGTGSRKGARPGQGRVTSIADALRQAMSDFND